MENEKIDISYDTLWKAIIRPPREQYDEDQLGESVFTYRGKTYIRRDYKILNKRGQLLSASFLETDIDTRPIQTMPVVVYLHGNSSCRLEGLKSAPELLKKDINIFIFDFAGCGKSEGDYISLGWYEKEDIKTIIDFLEKLPGVGRIGLWGRSMGAATVMLYAYSDMRVKAICMDSPFAEFRRLAKELCYKYISYLPNFLVDLTMVMIKQTVKEKSNLDIDKLQPLLYSNKTYTPAFFVHAMNDELISLDQTIKLYEEYAGVKSLNVVEGGHNSCRQKHIVEKISKFFAKYLNNEDYDCNSNSNGNGNGSGNGSGTNNGNCNSINNNI